MTNGEWAFCREALIEVSRTFSKPIEMLPGTLEHAVTCGYLLCRVADTIEDDDSLTLEQREELFERFLAVMQKREPVEAFCTAAARIWQGDDAESRLARRLDTVMSVFWSLDDGIQACVTPWVEEMARGMALYRYRRPGSNGYITLLNEADLERYCYFVAGTVGQMLTELFVHWIPDIDDTRRIQMREHAESFALGLQLVNIMKDITDDYERGVCFVPATLLRRVGLSESELLLPESLTRAQQSVAPIFARIDEVLRQAFTYTLAIPPEQKEIRLFCLLPLWMAVRTAQVAQGHPSQFVIGEPVKISREEVARLIADCVRRAGDDSALRDGWHQLREKPLQAVPTAA